MTYDLAETGFEGFPVPYGFELAKALNKSLNESRFNLAVLVESGRAVSRNVKFLSYPKTDDGYSWIGGLEFNVKNARVAILFPWFQNWDNPKSQMDRLINVYSDMELPTQVVRNLLEKVAHQITLKSLRRKASDQIPNLM